MLSKCVRNSHAIAKISKIDWIDDHPATLVYCMICEAYYDITDGQLLSKKGVIKTE